MKLSELCTILVGVGLLTVSLPAEAHHSFAMFDQTKTIEFKGVTVSQFQWSNPHVYLLAQKGNTVYTLECSSPSGMRGLGWKFNSVKPGDKVDLTFFPLRDGRPGGELRSIILGDGQTLKAW